MLQSRAGERQNPMNIEQALAQGIQRLGIPVPVDAAARLAAYIALLERWNRVYNLTAVRRPEEMASRHILDSLAILPWVQGPRVLDVGSGAGLPGLPLAVARPEWACYLLDNNGKRTRFMQQAVNELGLVNVSVIRCRLEDYQPAIRFDSIVSRAFAALAEMVAGAGRLCAPGGRLLAMKGVYPQEEIAVLPPGHRVAGVYRLQVPGLDAERHLVHLVPLDANTQADV
jgi:16S rRNA (guanine527-N7)-methyltransferase